MRYRTLILLLGILASALLGPPSTVPTAQAAALDQRRGDDGSRWDRGRDRHDGGRSDRDRRDGGWSDRNRNDGGWSDRNRNDGDRHDRAGRHNWHRFRHDDFGDCFRTPWGLACETDTPGMFLVRDRHPGDEPGPDCDVLFIDGPVWWCYDSPYR
jgi:hypothetical protein